MVRRVFQDPRSIAYEVLSAVDEKEAYADYALDSWLRRSAALEERDRRLATELVYGTLRRRGSLDRYLGPSLRKPLERLDPEVLRILRLGAYQILFLERVPDHAAVNESVQLANRYGPRGSGSFVNAVLRALCRAKGEVGRSAAGQLGSVDADFPEWLHGIWTKELGREKAGELGSALVATPQTVLRANRLKTDRTRLLERLAAEGFQAAPVRELPQAVRLTEGGDIRKTGCYRDGWCVQQDGASQLVVEILDPRPGERVLDLCAAPGIKTTHIAEKMDNQGLIIAFDISHARLRELAEGCRRMGVSAARPVCGDASGPGHPLDGSFLFDRILIDAPCSGLGILRRNPERKWRPAPDFSSLEALQEGLTATAAPLLRRGGVLVYSTCTVHRQENEEMVERFLAAREDYVLEHVNPFLPEGLEDLASGAGHFASWARPASFDLFFAARLRRL